MVRLEDIDSPAELRSLHAGELPALADQIRGFLIRNVARTGGHLGSNLGVVESSHASSSLSWADGIARAR